MNLSHVFRPDVERYEGLRPIIVHGMRLGYLMVFVFVGPIVWTRITSHEGYWDPVQAAALSMWAAHALLSLIGVFRPLQMLPLVLFEIVYKLVWLTIVALPLWLDNRLAGSSAEPMTDAFLWVALPMAFVPWRYVLRKYLWRTRSETFS
jgi:hypothetical protein